MQWNFSFSATVAEFSLLTAFGTHKFTFAQRDRNWCVIETECKGHNSLLRCFFIF